MTPRTELTTEAKTAKDRQDASNGMRTKRINLPNDLLELRATQKAELRSATGLNTRSHTSSCARVDCDFDQAMES